MTLSRLNLNFKLESMEERSKFVHSYLDSIPFTPTSSELDLISKYILWGKNSSGKNGRQEGLELETKHRTWDSRQVESLEALMESPSFSESKIRRLSEVPTRIPREKFSRSRARALAPSHILDPLESLWRSIDETELLLNFYELAHNKRKNPPRPELLARFTTPDLTSIENRARSLSSYKYLQLKHELVDMRREQYTLKDEYAPPITSISESDYVEDPYITFGEDLIVLPLGIPSSSVLFSKIFNAKRYPNPTDFTDADLRELSTLLWTPAPSLREGYYFDFRNTDHLYRLYGMWEDLVSTDTPLDSNLDFFLRAASMYRTLAALDPLHSEILDFKIEKIPNQTIANYINDKYNKSYRANYISTLYCKKCIASIAAAASRHREILENCFFPENFKTCKDCGQILLMDEENFMRRKRSSDGFSPRCKRCDKKIRDLRNKGDLYI